VIRLDLFQTVFSKTKERETNRMTMTKLYFDRVRSSEISYVSSNSHLR